MTDDDNNIVLRLLREIRDDTQDLRARLTPLERHMAEARESIANAMGYSALAFQNSENSGERFDELTDEIAALKSRIKALETRHPT